MEEMGMDEEAAIKYLNVSTTGIARWGGAPDFQTRFTKHYPAETHAHSVY